MNVREFGQHLRAHRRAQGLTQDDLAALTGGQVSARTIEKYESPHPPEKPDYGKVSALIEALGWDAREALGLLGYTPRHQQLPEWPADDPRAELDALWPELTDHQRRGLVTVAEIMLNRPRRTTGDGEVSGFLMRAPTPGAGVRAAVRTAVGRGRG